MNKGLNNLCQNGSKIEATNKNRIYQSQKPPSLNQTQQRGVLNGERKRRTTHRRLIQFSDFQVMKTTLIWFVVNHIQVTNKEHKAARVCIQDMGS